MQKGGCMNKARYEYATACNIMVGCGYNDIVKNYIISAGNFIEELESEKAELIQLLSEIKENILLPYEHSYYINRIKESGV